MKTKDKLGEAVTRWVHAGRLLQAGPTPPQVTAMVNAPRQTVYRWRDALQSEGQG